MDTTKRWWESSAIWGGVASAIAGAAGLLGYTVSAEDAQALASSASQVVQLVTSVGALGGGVLAIIGRIRASKVIA